MLPFDKLLILLGAALIGGGLLLSTKGSIPYIGKLPGDLTIKGANFQFYFPFTTCLLISLALSLLYFLFGKK
jgi:hypothetical protein